MKLDLWLSTDTQNCKFIFCVRIIVINKHIEVSFNQRSSMTNKMRQARPLASSAPDPAWELTKIPQSS